MGQPPPAPAGLADRRAVPLGAGARLLERAAPRRGDGRTRRPAPATPSSSTSSRNPTPRRSRRSPGAWATSRSASSAGGAGRHFGDGDVTYADVDWPLTAAGGLALLDHHHDAWIAGVREARRRRAGPAVRAGRGAVRRLPDGRARPAHQPRGAAPRRRDRRAARPLHAPCEERRMTVAGVPDRRRRRRPAPAEPLLGGGGRLRDGGPPRPGHRADRGRRRSRPTTPSRSTGAWP